MVAAVEVSTIRKVVIAAPIMDLAVLAAYRQLRQERSQIDFVGLCQIVENVLRDLVRGHSGLIDLESLRHIRAVQHKVLLRRAVFKGIVPIRQLNGEGDGLFVLTCIDGIITGIEYLVILTSHQRKWPAGRSIAGIRTLKLYRRVCGQVCCAIVCLYDVADRDRCFVSCDRPSGGFLAGVVAVVCRLDGQSGGADSGTGIAADDGVINSRFQLAAVVRYNIGRHAGGGVIRLIDTFIAVGERDCGFAEIQLGDGQHFGVARYRIAVLAGREINPMLTDFVEVALRDVIPCGADFLIFTCQLGETVHAVAPAFSDEEVHTCAAGIAVGAEPDGRAALHLRVTAGQVLPINFQRQGLGGDWQTIDDDIVQLRGTGRNIRRGVPLVSAVPIEHLIAKAVRFIQDVCPCGTLCQLQRADNGGESRTGEVCSLVGNDGIDTGCGRVFRVA